jgi:hypothetical protein
VKSEKEREPMPELDEEEDELLPQAEIRGRRRAMVGASKDALRNLTAISLLTCR